MLGQQPTKWHSKNMIIYSIRFLVLSQLCLAYLVVSGAKEYFQARQQQMRTTAKVLLCIDLLVSKKDAHLFSLDTKNKTVIPRLSKWGPASR
jgi:hypothetical protein